MRVPSSFNKRAPPTPVSYMWGFLLKCKGPRLESEPLYLNIVDFLFFDKGLGIVLGTGIGTSPITTGKDNGIQWLAFIHLVLHCFEALF